MKYLYPDIISAVTADEEDASYPAEYVMNDDLGLPWKATSADAQLKLTVNGNADTIAFAAINAIAATVTVKNTDETETLWGPTEYDLTGITNFFQFFTQSGATQTELWVAYDEQYDAHKVIVDWEAETGDIVEVGIARAALAFTLPDPMLGVAEYLKDLSVKEQLEGGGDYYDFVVALTGYRLRVRLDREYEFYMVMRRLAKQIGETNIFWRLVNADSVAFTIFGHFDGLPAGPHQYPKKSIVNINLLEGY